MHAIAPTPPGAGAVTWWASALLAEPSDLAEDRRATRVGRLPLLEHEDGGALAHHEPVAIGVERAARARRRQRGHVPEAGHRRRGARRLGAARDDRVGEAPGDEAGGVPDGVGSGRARGADRLVRAR